MTLFVSFKIFLELLKNKNVHIQIIQIKFLKYIRNGYSFYRNSTNKNLPKSVEIVKKVKYLKALDTKFRPKTRARFCRHIMAA